MDKNFTHKISLGQNFLINRNVLRRSVEAGAIVPSDVLLEIGAGQGALTRELMNSSCSFLHAVEIDRRLEPWLQPLETECPQRLKITWGDAMQISFNELYPQPNKILANIPYNITTPLIWKALTELAPLKLELLILMVQKEAADRIAAPAGTKDRGPLSVTLELLGGVNPFMRVSPGSFNPPPKISSSLITVKIERHRFLASDKFWIGLLRSAFAQRRKTLINNLAAEGFAKEKLEHHLEALQIPLNARAEELESQQWFDLYSALIENPLNENI